ncbi:efflux ABC transporter [Capsaspora owczarzaki ATCC 30864]|uniref:Efflux ABC transporter n=1 Tax=Capsaspora owczarzaki (strain ATCC 30864) TaxID=595528 RepID=A0A0D2WME8_CAPO3|nr:efflux ABC transporter [Capsaspora owczarzaki ATCC 30864]KJE91990.1 efflux ABC transporter [Capsaspora owczarzaki ATCC 30864]|eukprot:XP_004363871.1 efflux ABC transporter [Capsaspora owczarzaki ATCC 30864]
MSFQRLESRDADDDGALLSSSSLGLRSVTAADQQQQQPEDVEDEYETAQGDGRDLFSSGNVADSKTPARPKFTFAGLSIGQGHGHGHSHGGHGGGSGGGGGGGDSHGGSGQAHHGHSHGWFRHSHAKDFQQDHGMGHSHDRHGHLVRMSAIAKFAQIARPERTMMLVGAVALSLSVAVNLFLPYSLGSLLADAAETGSNTTTTTSNGEVREKTSFSTIVNMTFVYMAIYVFGSLMTSTRAFAFSIAGERLVRRVRCALYASILSQPMSFFDKARSGELLNRLSADTDLLKHTISLSLAQALRFLVQVIGGTLFLFYLSWQMTLVLLSVIPLVALGGWCYTRKARVLSRTLQDALAEDATIADEVINGMRHVQAFGRQDFEQKRFTTHLNATYKYAHKLAMSTSIFMGAAEFGSYWAVLMVILYGAHLLIEGQLSSSFVTSYILYAVYVAHALGALSHVGAELSKCAGAVERLMQLLSLFSSSQAADSPNFSLVEELSSVDIRGYQPRDGLRGLVEFEHVCFSYDTVDTSISDRAIEQHTNSHPFTTSHIHHPTTGEPMRPSSGRSKAAGSDRQVLMDVSFVAQPRMTIGLVGPSGAGKSSILQLLLAFYAPSAGSIKIDGHPIESFNSNWLRQNVGYVSQDPTLFCCSIGDNIRYGRLDATQAEVEEAARVALIHDFIMSLPHGYNTIVGERGAKLSGGQRQRIAIARVVLKNAMIVLMDEPTSALDAESEQLVQQALEALYKNRTCLIVSHRLDVIRSCDLILVFEHGRLIEKGTHQELQGAGKTYSKLLAIQSSS